MYLPTAERLFAEGEDEKLRTALAEALPDDELLGALDAVLCAMRGGEAALPTLLEGADDALFLRQIWELRARIAPDGRLRTPPRPHARLLADVRYDFLDKTCDAPWSVAKIMNFVALGRIKPTRRAAVVTTMRNDGISVLEFVAHHRALGFERIFVFSNDNTDGTTELLTLLADHGIITYIDNPLSPDTSPQRKAFEYAVHFLIELREFEWVFFADSDELLMPGPQYGFDIQAVLDAVDRAHPTDQPSAICYCWKWYGGHSLHREHGLQHERFQYSRIIKTVKSLARLRDIKSMRPLHYPICKRLSFFVNSAFERVETSLISREPANISGGYVNHYWHKSFEEFVLKRWRGDALLYADETKNDYRSRRDEHYFAWNVPATPEHHDPSPPEVVAAVRREYRLLLALPGVDDLNQRISQEFGSFLRSRVEPEAVRRRFDSLAPRFAALRLRTGPPPHPAPVAEACMP